MQHDDRPEPVSYGNCGWYSYLIFGWVNPLVETGVQRQVTLDDLPELSKKEDPLVNTRVLLRNLDANERARRSHPLLRSLAFSYWPEFLVIQTLMVAQHFLGLLDPILMAKVLVFQERQNAGKPMTSAEKRTGFEAVAALIALGFFMIFYNNQLQFYRNRLAVRIGSALRGVVLFRCIQGQRATNGGPSAYNVISFDIDPIVDIIWIILGVWLFPIQFISTLAVLFQHVGWAVVPGVIVIMVAKLVCGILLYRDGILRHQLLAAKDRRLRYCSEGFLNIRTLHMLAWRQPFQDQIMEARTHELQAQKMRLWMMKMAAALDYSLSMIVTFATLGYYVYSTGDQLKASVAIPVIQLIVNLIAPIGQFPTWLNQYLIWKSAYSRISAFIGLDVHPKAEPDQFANDVDSPPGPPPDFGDKVAAVKDCSFSWAPPPTARQASLEEGQPLLEQNVFELRNLDFGVKNGDLLVFVGLEGQGKSSLLLGLLGEMTVKSGSALSPAIKRHTEEKAKAAELPGLPEDIEAYRKLAGSESERAGNVNPLAVPISEQTAMLFTGSIRMNILFGSPYLVTLYKTVLKACALEDDLATMPAGDLTEVAQAGATLSGGQRRRISLARTVYRASVALDQQPNFTPLVLLDDPLCSLDRQVAKQVSDALFGAEGLLARCAVVVATADPWWVSHLEEPGPKVALLRSGYIAYYGSRDQIQGSGFEELEGFFAASASEDQSGGDDQSGASGGQGFRIPQLPPPTDPVQSNPQDEDNEVPIKAQTLEKASPRAVVQDGETQTPLTEAQKEALHVVKEEDRDEGQVKWSTYEAYGSAVGISNLSLCATALVGIMVFQNFCNLWITYWTAEDKSNSFVYNALATVGVTPPENHKMLLWIFFSLVMCFTLCNFAGHSMEIIGGVSAAKKLFQQAVEGAFSRPFRWWDANPTGRVLNRFSEDVLIMDQAITNIMGVIFGALLYFVGHTVILAISNPSSLLLLPFIAAGLEYYAKFYRMTIREVHRIFRVRMGLLYQDMLEAIVGRITVRSFARENQVMESALDNLDRYQQASFCKLSLALWLGFRMALIGYILTFWVKLRPILQFYGVVGEQSAAMVGFSMTYSTETVMIIQQFINNYSDLEMQLISIERLSAYDPEAERRQAIGDTQGMEARGLQLKDVTVTYRVGLLPALVGVTLFFPPGEVAAIVGRTGAGKTSLLLSVLQLVPYEGRIMVNGESLEELESEEVRRRLVGVVPQLPVLFEGTLRWNLDPENVRSDEDIWGALAAVGLENKCRTPAGLAVEVSAGRAESQTTLEGEEPVEEKEVVEFSSGQQQMLCAARVLLRKPKVAMLDEVASSLPIEAASSMVSTLVNNFKELKTTVLMVTHQENLLACCERVVRIAGGRVVGDSRT